ncbi:olfactory receptor 5W2-like [Natator depressus]|uniref:olfactory receptor 5W2-like n=1 Tax=Natator depressus TaxID=27790 RepID=UPI003EBC54DA
MYFFLRNLSFCDLCVSLIISPKMLLDFLAERKKISFTACTVQMHLSIVFGDIQCLLLAVMAYDRYVAICNLLLYTVAMSRHLCKQLVIGVYTVGVVDSMIYVCCTFQLSFCSSNIINHFFCDVLPLLVLSCSDTRINEIVTFVFMSCITGSSFVTILLSYVYIISTILQVCCVEGQSKAFFTCSFHLTSVVLFFGTLLFMYLRPTSSYSMDTDKIVSVFYSLVIPMLKTLIYSLRNAEVKDALRKAIHSAKGQRKAFSTCTFHLTTVVLLFGTLLFMYLCPTSSYSMDRDKMASVFYTLVILMLNPLIYSLRNKEVKYSLRKALNKLLTNS